MATREENLKKINDELEQLSDEELEDVAGGAKNPFAEVPGGVEIPITGIFWKPPEINNQNPANRLLIV